LADSWLAAKEPLKATPVLQKIAALDSSGESDLRYSRVLFDLEQWQNTEDSLSKTLKKLKGKQVGKALLLLGMTQFHLDKLSQAKESFTKATQYQDDRSQAGQWLRHIESLLPKEEAGES
jgi:tetratricopeptide (TPR) repeat protein